MQIIRNWLENKCKCTWLMVVDNVDDAIAFFKEKNSFGKSLSEYLPQCPRGSIVYTTRDRRVGVNLVPGRHPISVQPMNPSEARILLEKRVEGRSTAEEQEELLKALDYLPLAISQAAAFITERRQTVAQYLAKFQQSASTRKALLKYDFTDHGRETRPMESVATTFMISFDYIQMRNPRASAILCTMSFLDPQGIPKSLIMGEDEGELEFEDAVGMLDAFSLINTNAQLDTYEVHRLVQLSTRTWLSERGEGGEATWALQALELLGIRFPGKGYEGWITCATYLPHAEAVLRDVFLEKPSTSLGVKLRAELLLNTSIYYLDQGRFKIAEERTRESLQLCQEELGDKNPITLKSVCALALALHRQGEFAEAERMGRLALSGCEKVLGKEHRNTVTCVNNLALSLTEQGRYEDAEQMNRLALERREKELGKEHPSTIISVSNLAFTLSNQGRYEEAEQINRLALERSEKVLGKEHPDTITSVSNLASTLSDQGRHEEAEQMNRLALERREKVLGKEHPDTLNSLRWRAYLLRKLNRQDEAIPLYIRAIEGFRKTLGETHPRTQACIHEYSSLVEEMKEKDLS
jgi:tetratricopeptide (TPR) repeat protein